MNDNNVYLGVWTNWSKGTVMGATLTMTRQQGDLLIAFTGFLIPFVASRFWRILCFILHLYYSTSKPEDAIYHQRQVILRNSSSPDTGLVSFSVSSGRGARTTRQRQENPGPVSFSSSSWQLVVSLDLLRPAGSPPRSLRLLVTRFSSEVINAALPTFPSHPTLRLMHKQRR
jgi:hypothetical protein